MRLIEDLLRNEKSMNETSNVFQKESVLYSTLEHSQVQCRTCWHQCVIANGKFGHCRTRKNLSGKLYCINYGMISSFSINPIEKKPLFNYYPGTHAVTVGSYSCNFDCPWCQNWSLSKHFPAAVLRPRYVSPHQLVSAVENDSTIDGISISFNEPTLSLEYALDTFNLCPPDIYRMFVTNAYMTDEALHLLISAGMTGMSINVKGLAPVVKKYCHSQVDRVWDNIQIAHQNGVHVEIICLIIPTVNDAIDFYHHVASRLLAISPDIPLHFIRFYPAYQFTHVNTTPIKDLEAAYQIARSAGLNYVYLGNVFSHPLENTYCPNCHQLLIKRTGSRIEVILDTQKGQCSSCNTEIPIFLG